MVSIRLSQEKNIGIQKEKGLSTNQMKSVQSILEEFRILQEPSQSVWLEVVYYNLLEL